MNFFQTHKHTHEIPNDVLKRAIVLSPKGDWTDKSTKAYEYLKAWALNEDIRRGGAKDDFKGVVNADGVKAEDMESVYYFEGVGIPDKIMQHAQMMSLQSGKPYQDKRTKAYKYLKNWVQDKNNEES